MYDIIEKIYRIQNYISKKYPEPTLDVSTKIFKVKSYQHYTAFKYLSLCYDNLTKDPLYILESMLIETHMLYSRVSKNKKRKNYALYFMYDTEINTLNDIMQYLRKEN